MDFSARRIGGTMLIKKKKRFYTVCHQELFYFTVDLPIFDRNNILGSSPSHTN